MTIHLPSFAVNVAFSVLIGCASAMAQPIAAHSEALPVGPNSPEGAACDLIRAYMAKDAALFHKRRCRVSCEGVLDPAIAYEKFIGYKPRALQGKAKGNLQHIGPSVIVKVLPVAPTPISDEEAGKRRFDLLLNYGAFESTFIDIITVMPCGHQDVFRVESMHMVKQTDGAMFSKPKPSGIWRARLVDKNVAQGSQMTNR